VRVEADSVEAVRGFLDPATAGMARNEYFEAPNKEGLCAPDASPHRRSVTNETGGAAAPPPRRTRERR